jgi:CheY-like chemotaxis protein
LSDRSEGSAARVYHMCAIIACTAWPVRADRNLRANLKGPRCCDPVPTANDDDATEATSLSPRQRKILIVDDCDDAATAMPKLLEFLGCEVEVTRDGSAGLATALRWHPEVIFANMGLQGEMDAYTLAAAIRAGPDDIKNIYLIAMSGSTREDDRLHALAAGYDLHLTKPVSAKLLHGVLADIAAMTE